MKRFLILLLCISLLQIYIPANAASDSAGSVFVVDAVDSVNILQAAGIINQNKKIVLESEISRGDFAMLASRIALHGNFASGTSVVFPDVNNQNENFEAINILSSAGIISGYEDGTFKPDGLISQGEAAKIIIKSLGWDAFMINDKNNSSEFFSVAISNKLFRGIEVSIDKKMTWAETAKLFTNVLSANVCVQTAFGSKEKFQRYSDVTYFNLYFDIYKISGCVTDNGVTALSGPSRIAERNIIIGETLLVDKRVNKNDLLGFDVDAYYKHVQGEEAELIYAVPVENKVLKLTSSMIYDFDDNVYYYHADENDEYEYKAKLLPEFDLIYNGKAVLPGDEIELAELIPEIGYIELIDCNKDSRYETVKLWAYNSFVVSSINVDYLTIYDKFGGTPISLEDKEKYTITDKNGNALSISDIHPMDILSVAESFDGKLISIIRNTSGFNARLDAIGKDGIYLLSGSKYRPSSDFLTRYESQLKIGMYADFYVNHEGFLVYMDTSSEPRAGMGYLVDATKDERGINPSYLVKLFGTDGNMRIYRLAEKVTVNGNRISVADAYDMLFEDDGTTVKCQLLDYSIDGEESVNMLDFAYYISDIPEEVVLPEENESTYSLHRHGANKNANMTFLANTFDGKILIDASTKIFLVPTNGDEDAYQITNTAYFNNNTGYRIDAYRHDPESAIAEALVMKLDHTGRRYYDARTPASLVKSISSVLDDNGNVVQQLVCYQNGAEVTVNTAEDNVLQVVSGDETIIIAPGDIIRYGVNNKGIIDKGNLMLIYDADANEAEDAEFVPVSAGSYTGSFFMYLGYAYTRSDNILRVSPSAEDGVRDSNLYSYDLTGGKVIVVNKSDKYGYTFRTGTQDDILDYKSTGADCSKVFIYTWSAKPRMIVIYE